ncbi:alpha-galactosidase [Microbacterium sp. NEAU-LLC]|uniref:alpha-galactosidase n=1 Tax=Microbacterium helvum TaxID=2773713 RepID=A0ABR8NL25_9MICO|nr:alpha-galactosidase [Microbacterium helvum]MBD3941365.1 alpha-galactosidase [Microbacterium helvum]
MVNGDGAVHTLRAAGVALVVDLAGPHPRVLHWGADLGDLDPEAAAALRVTAVPAVLNNSPDVPRVFSVWPTEQDGWAGTPAQAGHRGGTATTPRPRLVDADVVHATDGGGRIALRFDDDVAGTCARLQYGMDAAGVLSIDLSIENPAEAASPYSVDGLRALVPLPDRAGELLDFTGKWCRERSPQRLPFAFGTHARRARRGKPGHDTPFLLVAGTPAFGFGHGEVWGAHLAWSGDGEYLAERLPEGAGALSRVIGAGELLRSGEMVLQPGERYDAPTVLFTWSDRGLDGLSARFHRRLRARRSHPGSPRPLVLNTWEAVYFDHDLERLVQIADRAAEVGVERIVLDDGWFQGRRDANAGLGDWLVDERVWPDGLGPFVDAVRARGMQFGLWFEPEMISPDSDLARAHPDWVLAPREGVGPTARSQHVLDIANPDAYALVLERISALVAEYDIDYLKWDHNRDLVEPVGRRGDGDRPLVHDQTLALYRLLDELRARHPRLEIETCSGGGGRVDLGILERTDRVWASDCNDPVERARIERWTRLLVPPELIGSHLGAGRSHTTSRETDLSFRLAVALTAHAGIESDLTVADPDDLATITAWAALYRELRDLIHTGTVVNADLADDAAMLTGIVAPDGGRALFTWARLATSPDGQSGRVRFPGLDAAAHYRVRVRAELGPTSRHEVTDPEWMLPAVDGGIELPGTVLAVAGVPLPTLNPQQALLFDVVRVA